MCYLATFHTHFGALTFSRRLAALGDTPAMMPVPRRLSASCGTCVRFALEFHPETMADEDLDAVYRVQNEEYTLLYRCKED